MILKNSFQEVDSILNIDKFIFVFFQSVALYSTELESCVIKSLLKWSPTQQKISLTSITRPDSQVCIFYFKIHAQKLTSNKLRPTKNVQKNCKKDHFILEIRTLRMYCHIKSNGNM